MKSLNKTNLDTRIDSPWRAALQMGIDAKPQWRALYKSPLSKKDGHLHWRILQGGVTVNVFVSILSDDVH